VLFEPDSYKQASEAEIFAVVNGCGSAKAKFDFVPDTIWGLRITEACFIHDWCYYIGKTEEDKEFADLMFLGNMLKLIQTGKRVLRPLRRRRALKYYEAVTILGDKAFYNET